MHLCAVAQQRRPSRPEKERVLQGGEVVGVFCCCYGALTALTRSEFSSAASGETQIIKYTRPRALLPIYIKYGVAPFTLNSPFKPRLPEFLQSPRRLFYARRLLSLRTPTALRISMPYSNSSKHTHTHTHTHLLDLRYSQCILD
jgi:hypothetical protein